MAEYLYVATNLDVQVMVADSPGAAPLAMWISDGNGGKPKAYYRVTTNIMAWLYQQMEKQHDRADSGQLPRERLERAMEKFNVIMRWADRNLSVEGFREALGVVQRLPEIPEGVCIHD